MIALVIIVMTFIDIVQCSADVLLPLPGLVAERGHQRVTEIAFSHDDRYIYSLGTEGTIGIWDIDSQTEVMVLDLGSGYNHMGLTQLGKYLAASDNTGRIDIWDTALWSIRNTIFTPDVRILESMAISPDGQSLCCVVYKYNASTVLLLIDAKTGKSLLEMPIKAPSPSVVRFSHDGHCVAASVREADNSYPIEIWNLAEHTLHARLTGHTRQITSVRFTHDDAGLVSSSYDGTVKIWDLATSQPVDTFNPHGPNPAGHPDFVEALALSADDSLVFSSTWLRKLQLWRHGSTAPVVSFPDPANAAEAIALSGSGKLLALGCIEGTIEIRDLEHNTIRSLHRHFQGATHLGISSNRRRLAAIIEPPPLSWSQSAGHLLWLWDLGAGQPYALVASGKYDGPLAVSPNGEFVATVDYSTIHLFNGNNGASLSPLSVHTVPIGAVRITPPPEHVVSADWEGHVDISSIGSAALPDNILRAARGGQVAVSPDGRKVAIGGWVDAKTHEKTPPSVWDIASRSSIALPCEPGAVAYDPNGRWLAAGGGLTPAGSVFSIFDTQADYACHRSIIAYQHTAVVSLSFSPDGRRIVTGGVLDVPKIWDVETGNLVRALNPYLKLGYDGLEFYSDSRMLFAKGPDGIEVIDTVTGSLSCTLAVLDDGSWVVITPNGLFDTNNLEKIRGLHWIFGDAPYEPISIETFRRDFYIPRLLSRLLSPVTRLPLAQRRDLALINRVRPVISKIAVDREPGSEDLVTVTVDVTDNRKLTHVGDRDVVKSSGIYDLRLFRDGQIVGEKPDSALNAVEHQVSRMNFDAGELANWQVNTRICTGPGTTVAVQFPHIRLPRVNGVDNVRFSAYAFNEDRAKSDTFSMDYPLQRDLSPRARRAYLVTVGVNSCNAGFTWNLSTPANDVRLLQRNLPPYLKNTYPDVVSVSLISSSRKLQGAGEFSATKESIKSVFDALSGQIENSKIPPSRAEDLVIFFFSCHGFASSTSPYYLVPANPGEAFDTTEDLLADYLDGKSIPFEQEVRNFVSNCISVDELSSWIRGVDAREIVLIVDACHSGAAVGSEDVFRPGPMGDPGFGQMAYDKRMRLLSSTQAAGISIGDGYGLLTYALVQVELLERKPATLDLKAWLSGAVNDLPDLYKGSHHAAEDPTPEQRPQLFDFNS
jgi:WD40 repeat protein